jgi:pyridinium-3,5-biscarboxylic acid mononucleotide sulfurtransferase
MVILISLTYTNLTLIDRDDLTNKLDRVKEEVRGKKIIVAFSGGVDSSLIATICKEVALKVLLVMQVGYSVGIGEKENAIKVANQIDVPIKFLQYDEYELSDEYKKNPSNRCFYCKTILYSKLYDLLNELNFDIIVNGTNADDLEGHRPGHQAALNKNVLFPMASCNLSKHEIRLLAKDYGLLTWDKPATPCIASRFITGIEITKQGLIRVREAEAEIKNVQSISILRVRDLGNKHCRVEIGLNELNKLSLEDRKNIHDICSKWGFENIEISKDGYKTYTPL